MPHQALRCIRVETGLIVIADQDYKVNETDLKQSRAAEISVVPGRVDVEVNEIVIPLYPEIIDHLTEGDQPNIFVYGQGDPEDYDLPLYFSFVIDKKALYEARGACLILDKMEKAKGQPLPPL